MLIISDIRTFRKTTYPVKALRFDLPVGIATSKARRIWFFLAPRIPTWISHKMHSGIWHKYLHWNPYDGIGLIDVLCCIRDI